MPRHSVELATRLLSVAVAVTPVVLMGVYAFAFFAYQPNSPVERWLGEGRIIEVTTYVAALCGGVFGLWLAWRLRRKGQQRLVWSFYLVFALGLVVLGMEEISWGQHIWHYETPEVIKPLNKQKEFNLHNLHGWSGKNSLLRVFFGTGALLGYWLGRYGAWRPMAPPRVLLPWFVIIAVAGILEAYTDLVLPKRPLPHAPLYAFFSHRIAEITELFVAVSGPLYLLMQSWRLRGGQADEP